MKKLLLHLRNDSPGDLQIAISYLNNFCDAAGKAEKTAVLLVNGPAVKGFVKDSAVAPLIQVALSNPAVTIRLCHHALMKEAIPENRLLAGCAVVPYGIMELVDRQADGFSYVKI